MPMLITERRNFLDSFITIGFTSADPSAHALDGRNKIINAI